MLWAFFHKIKLGDVIVARQGLRKLLAVGTVTRTAYYDPNKTLEAVGDWFTFAYHLDVRWDESPRDKVFADRAFGMQTVHKISEEKFRRLLDIEALEGDSDAGEDEGAHPDSTNKLLAQIADVVAEDHRWCVACQSDTVVNCLPADWLNWLPPLGNLYDDERIWLVFRFESKVNRVDHYVQMHGVDDAEMREKLAVFLWAEAPKCGFKRSQAYKPTNFTAISRRERLVEWEDAESEPATIRQTVQDTLTEVFPKLEKLAAVLEPFCKGW
jgi:hypothetical protein